jgi:hypothetical protein
LLVLHLGELEVLQVGGRRVARGDWIEEFLLGSTNCGVAVPIKEDTFDIRSVSAFQEISVQLRDLIGKTQIGIKVVDCMESRKAMKERKKLTKRDPRCRASDDRLALSSRVRGNLSSLDPPGNLNRIRKREKKSLGSRNFSSSRRVDRSSDYSPCAPGHVRFIWPHICVLF